MLEWLVQTDGGVVGLILRLTLAVVIFPHGAQKVFGWFGGYGFKNTLQSFTSSGIPTGFALLAIAAEFLGSLGLAVGPHTRRGLWHRVCDARGHRHGALAARLLHELVRYPARRGLRVPPAGAGYRHRRDDPGWRRLVGGWGADRRRRPLAVAPMCWRRAHTRWPAPPPSSSPL
jgi:hypothetical protein